MQTKKIMMRFGSALTTAVKLTGVLLLWTICLTRPALAVEYTVGIVPQQSASELAERWVPIVKYWSDTSGVTFHFRTSKDIATFHTDGGKGLYDILFSNAHHYTVFNQALGYVAFAKEIECTAGGLIVVPSGSAVEKVEQLEGAAIAFASPSAVMGTWLPAQHLKQKGVSFSPHYVKSMDSVYRSVAKGLFPAGGGEQRTLGGLDPEIKSHLRILWKSDFPCHPFSVHPRVPREIVQQLQKAMFSMHKNSQAMAMLKAVNMKGFGPANDADYNGVRKMKLKPFEAK